MESRSNGFWGNFEGMGLEEEGAGRLGIKAFVCCREIGGMPLRAGDGRACLPGWERVQLRFSR